MSSAAIKRLIREVVREELGKGKLSGKKGGGTSRKSIHKSSKKQGGNRTASSSFSKTKLIKSATKELLQEMCDLLGVKCSGLQKPALITKVQNKMTRDNFKKLKGEWGLGETLKDMFQCAGFQQSSVEYKNSNDYRFAVVMDSFRG